jgi:hypothetical protein
MLSLANAALGEKDAAFKEAGRAVAHAALGEKDAAFKEAGRAVALLPSAKDRMYGPGFEENLALIQTMFGANSQAISTSRAAVTNTIL